MNKTAIVLVTLSMIGFLVSNNLTSHGGDVKVMLGSFLLLGSIVLFIISFFLFIPALKKKKWGIAAVSVFIILAILVLNFIF